MLALIMSIENESDRLFVETLYIQYGKRIYLIAFSIIQNKEDAEDCTHDTIEKIIRNLDKFKDAHKKSRLEQLIVISCRNVAINKYNANKRRRELEYSTTIYMDDDDYMIMDIPDEGSNVENIVLSEENCQYIQSLIDQLDPIYRDVMVLKSMGWENDAIADLMHISVDLVRKRYSRARKKIIEMGGEQLYAR